MPTVANPGKWVTDGYDSENYHDTGHYEGATPGDLPSFLYGLDDLTGKVQLGADTVNPTGGGSLGNSLYGDYNGQRVAAFSGRTGEDQGNYNWMYDPGIGAYGNSSQGDTWRSGGKALGYATTPDGGYQIIMPGDINPTMQAPKQNTGGGGLLSWDGGAGDFATFAARAYGMYSGLDYAGGAIGDSATAAGGGAAEGGTAGGGSSGGGMSPDGPDFPADTSAGAGELTGGGAAEAAAEGAGSSGASMEEAAPGAASPGPEALGGGMADTLGDETGLGALTPPDAGAGASSSIASDGGLSSMSFPGGGGGGGGGMGGGGSGTDWSGGGGDAMDSVSSGGGSSGGGMSPEAAGGAGTGMDIQKAVNAAMKYGPLGMQAINMLGQKKATQKAAGQFGNIGGTQRGVANEMIAQAQAGQINPSDQYAIDQWAQNSRTQIEAFYSKAGLSDSTQKTQALADVAARATAMKEQARQQLLKTGMDALNVVDKYQAQAVQAEMQGDQAAAKQAQDFLSTYGQWLRALPTLTGDKPAATTATTGVRG